jgi:hypothetical protein
MWIMAMLLIAGLKVGTAQISSDLETNISCIDRLQMPTFPALARKARVQGTINAVVVLSPQGSVQTMNTKGHPLLVPSVEDIIRTAKFRSDCGGKTVTLVFDFRLAGSGSQQPMQSVSFGAPNRFWIAVQPLPALVNQSTVRP